MRYPDARILIFAKAPEPGRVKTRLIPALGEVGAAELHRRLLEATVAMTVNAGLCPVQCWCAPGPDHPFFLQMQARHGVALHGQGGGDLGERMRRAALAEAGSVLLVGADCPALTPGHLQQALAWLAAGEDAVLGPAEDGGYVLLGLRRVEGALFTGLPWGTEQVLRLTRARLRSLGWRWRELEMLWDLDRPADLVRWPPAAALLRQQADQR